MDAGIILPKKYSPKLEYSAAILIVDVNSWCFLWINLYKKGICNA